MAYEVYQKAADGSLVKLDLVSSVTSISQEAVLNSVYPVGSIYMSMNSASPASLFGGTWSQLTGRFLVGVGYPGSNTTSTYGTTSTYEYYMDTNSKGGSKSIKLELKNLPDLDEKLGMKTTGNNYDRSITPYEAGGIDANMSWSTNVQHTDGANAIRDKRSEKNIPYTYLPPYLSVFMWRRTA